MQNTNTSALLMAIGWPKGISLLYDSPGIVLTDFTKGEGAAYGACSYTLNGFSVIGRTAKQTPKKTGQFVAIWKRSAEGGTAPYTENDGVEFLVINAVSEFGCGQFIFPLSALLHQGVFSSAKKPGKRGIRVYPPWDRLTSKQAQNTQEWQQQYFLELSGHAASTLKEFQTAFRDTHSG
ncbi:MepB family protein [Arenibacter sp. 6A1]|uniref:MepB family protein n=1 Tax=Arenibacter sp. 6A1 TaxID=2720391 RepID=UPI001447567A|nr:MepB family protein [Arenibacter sp. 6A1]NKI26617.1 MepB family protein [Arenibacter sp. 6A1]